MMARKLPSPSPPPCIIRRRSKASIVIKFEKIEPNARKASLSAKRVERINLPEYGDGEGRTFPISEFLNHPMGVKSLLNTRALQRLEPVGYNTYRCTLQKIQFLKYEVAPVLELRVTQTCEDCMVEMLSCRFEGSKAMERQNEFFSAFMKNHIKWEAEGNDPYLMVDVQLGVNLEVFTKPFSLLPLSAVEIPGNLLMQSILDRLVPLLVEQLLRDYRSWVENQLEDPV